MHIIKPGVVVQAYNSRHVRGGGRRIRNLMSPWLHTEFGTTGYKKACLAKQNITPTLGLERWLSQEGTCCIGLRTWVLKQKAG